MIILVYLRSEILFLRNKRPLVMAHRGRSAFVPESSFQSFKEAYELKVDVLETDIRLTKDRIPVIFHDATLDRTTNGKGSIIDHTYEELQEFDLGYWYKDPSTNEYPFRNRGFRIISLLEMFEKFPSIRINMDIKDRISSAPEILFNTIREADAENRSLVGSFHHKQLRRFRSLNSKSQIPTSASPIEVLSFVLHLLVFTRRKFVALQVPPNLGFLKIITHENIKRAHKKNLAVHVWTINERGKMKQLLAWGIDGIFTDNPNMLLDVLESNLKEII